MLFCLQCMAELNQFIKKHLYKYINTIEVKILENFDKKIRMFNEICKKKFKDLCSFNVRL